MTLSKYLARLTIVGGLTLSAPAWADVPPDDVCSADALGHACDNAVDQGQSSQPGVCKSAMCQRATPDGPLTYACYRCEPLDGGMGGQSNEVGGAGAAAGGKSDSGGSPAGGLPATPVGGSAAGTAPATASGGSSAGKSSSSASSESKPSNSDDGGCSLSRPGGGVGVLAAALALLGFAVDRRYRRSRASR